jgi:glucose/arabinose dehydrogenase
MSGGPVPPIGSTSLLGEPGHTAPPPAATPLPEVVEPIEPLSSIDARECLARGEVLYALALQNANVRQSADTTACRIGRIPKGTLVRIDRAQAAPEASNAVVRAVLPEPTPTVGAPVDPVLPAIGYSEDIQPVFQRVCVNCHGNLVKLQGLQVTEYAPLMQGSITGTVVLPGDAAGSRLWQMIDSGRMPQMGVLTAGEKQAIKDWISAGAPQFRPQPEETGADEIVAVAPEPAAAAPTSSDRLWFDVADEDVNPVTDGCGRVAEGAQRLVSSELLLPVACTDKPNGAALELLRTSLALPPVAGQVVAPANKPAPTPAAVSTSSAGGDTASVASTVAASSTVASATAGSSEAMPTAFQSALASTVGYQAPAMGLPAASDADPWLIARGGLCVERKLPENQRGITALTFAPDGRLFLAFDSNLAEETDPLILYDAYHPSRSIAVWNPTVESSSTDEILFESTRVTGLDWDNGNLFVSRAGEVGLIPDGGSYQVLAGGFAVTSQLFHANNGIVATNGWLYLSAGGVVDGYSDGPIADMDEASAQAIVSGGNPWAARIVRAPIDSLLAGQSTGAFSTAGRGVRNPYGIAVDPAGRVWFTDNGATNLPEDVSAGDEVDMLDPVAVGAGEDGAPYYGFPLALTQPEEWYADPALVLPNTAAPTGIAWALGAIYFAQYGRNPGLYRMGVGGDGRLVAERVVLGWPILALATAPDGALWMGMGDGGLFRITSGCG